MRTASLSRNEARAKKLYNRASLSRRESRIESRITSHESRVLDHGYGYMETGEAGGRQR